MGKRNVRYVARSIWRFSRSAPQLFFESKQTSNLSRHDRFVANFVRRVLSFDKQALSTAKTIINHSGLPQEAELRATQEVFAKTLGWPGALERMSKLRGRGLGTAGELELNLGRHVGDL